MTSKKPTILKIAINGTNETMDLVLYPKRVRIRTHAERNNFASVQVDEAEEALRGWYAQRNQEVPDDELQMLKELNAACAAAEAVFTQPAEVPDIDVKPEFGTPEFWAWARRRRAEKDAERAAEGLPPLPTKAQKEKAKAEKAAKSAK